MALLARPLHSRVPPQTPPALDPEAEENMRRTSDMVDWRALTPLARRSVETALKPRKAEWLVVDGKPVPGVSDEVWRGAWRGGVHEQGWDNLPDTEEMPRMVDGSMLEWANVNTKLPNQEGYLDVDLELPLEGDPPADLVWDDMEEVEDGTEIGMWHYDWETEGRVGHADLQVGSTLKGYIVAQMLYHGAVVDCGAEFDGCAAAAAASLCSILTLRSVIFVCESDWMKVRDTLDLGVEVSVRVRAVRDGARFRFPLELDILLPDVAQLLRPPPEHPPIYIYPDEEEDEAAVRHAQPRLRLSGSLPSQLAAGRDIPPPPDYQGMVERVRHEVAVSYGQPAPAEKPTGKKTGRSTPAPASSEEELAADEEDEDEDDEERDE